MHFKHEQKGDVRWAKLQYGKEEHLTTVDLVRVVRITQENKYGSPTYFSGAPDPVIRVNCGSKFFVFTYMDKKDWDAINQYKDEHGDYHLKSLVVKPWWKPEVRVSIDYMKEIEELAREEDFVYFWLVFEIKDQSKLTNGWL